MFSMTNFLAFVAIISVLMGGATVLALDSKTITVSKIEKELKNCTKKLSLADEICEVLEKDNKNCAIERVDMVLSSCKLVYFNNALRKVRDLEIYKNNSINNSKSFKKEVLEAQEEIFKDVGIYYAKIINSYKNKEDKELDFLVELIYLTGKAFQGNLR
jgi:hypothetical protein